ncbi:MAG: (2Fe-2S)-binding protein [Halanaerobium sp.]
MRIKKHPVLGNFKKGREVTFTVDGKEIKGYEGEPIAAALRAAGIMVHRQTKKGSSRGVFCAIGRCTDCVMIVDGKPNVRTCITPLAKEMEVKTQYGVTDKP